MLKSLTFPCSCNPSPIAIPCQTQIRSRMMMVLRCRAGAQSLAEPNNLIRNRKRSTFYDVLRVNQTASSVEIKAAYRSLAKVYHPDAAADSHSPSDGHLFMEIHNAYETLSDPNARTLYDLSLGLAPDGHSRSSFGLYSVARRPTRRWETDQCW